MDLQGEVACNLELVRCARRSNRALLVIKPHPRDSIAKIEQIASEASRTFRHVIQLTDPWSYYLPFESIYVSHFATPRTAAMTTVVCSSSACISLELLYRQQCELGFGEANVGEHFARKWQSTRLQHEADLRRVVAEIRRNQRGLKAA